MPQEMFQQQSSQPSSSYASSMSSMEEVKTTGMTVAVDKLNLNAHGILQATNSPQLSPISVPSVRPKIQVDKTGGSSNEHPRTPFPTQVPPKNQWDQDFRSQGPGVQGISALRGPESNPPGGSMMMTEEQVLAEQRERRVHVQQEIQKEPIRNQIGRVQQELENQQFFQFPDPVPAQPRYPPVVQVEDRQTMLQRRASLQDQIQNLDQHLQQEGRSRAVSYDAQYQNRNPGF